ncbi:hypothetical protein [Streptomyces sp. NPDC052291]
MRCYEEQGLLTSHRLAGGHRRYDADGLTDHGAAGSVSPP